MTTTTGTKSPELKNVPITDSDGDGVSDDREIYAGTDLNNPDSLLRFVTVERVEHNVAMPSDRFSLPEEIKALVKK